jgi:hypothetical protein
MEEVKPPANRSLNKRVIHHQHRMTLGPGISGVTTRAFGKDLSNIQGTSSTTHLHPPKVLRVKSSIGSSNNAAGHQRQSSIMSGVSSGHKSSSRRDSVSGVQNVENIAINNIQ